jgi:dolichyl-phosphate-mannose--protein O-mannosyl transferase
MRETVPLKLEYFLTEKQAKINLPIIITLLSLFNAFPFYSFNFCLCTLSSCTAYTCTARTLYVARTLPHNFVVFHSCIFLIFINYALNYLPFFILMYTRTSEMIF